MKGHLGKQHSSVTLERRCRCGNPSSRTTQSAPGGFPCGALHLAIPEQAPSCQYSDTLLASREAARQGHPVAVGEPKLQ